MTLEESLHGNVAVLSMAGEFDTPEVEEFEDAVRSLAERGVVRVVVSLEKVTFVNSTALGSFIREHERLTQAGGELACAALSRFASKNFRLLGLDRRIRCYRTAEEGVESLRGEGEPAAETAAAPRVAFRFADEGAAAKERRAELLEARPDGLVFRLENLEGLDPEAAFRRGRDLAFRLGPGDGVPARGRVQTADVATGRKVVVRVAFEGLDGAAREAVARLAAELRAPRT